MSPFERYFASLSGKRIDVIGAGISNMPLIRLLASLGADLTVRDMRRPDCAAELEALGARTVFGEGYLDGLSGEVIFRTPGLLPTAPRLCEAAGRGVEVTSEMELFFELCPCKIIGITGSDGKTTTSTLIFKMLENAGKRVFLGGNIGAPLLPRIPEMTPGDIAVVELSSFQLMDMRRSPDIAVVTNVAPNHLDKHKDMAEYITAKKNIFAHQDKNGLLVVNYENEVTRAYASSAKGSSLFFSSKTYLKDGVCLREGEICLFGDPVLRASDIALPGVHNLENYMAAIGAVHGLVTKQDIETVAKTFGGVEHRCEFVRELRGVKYYNSSIDSSPTRTIAALSAFKQKVILIAGGYDKRIPFEPLGKPLADKAKRLILTGPTAQKIADTALSAGGDMPIDFCAGLEEAVRLAAGVSRPGDIVLLSPACASFDAFKNFEERGNAFKFAVSAL